MAAVTRAELIAYGATGVRQTRHYPLDLVDANRMPNVSLNKTTREATLNAGARLTGLDLTGWGLSIKGAGVYVGGCTWDARRVDLVPLYPVRLFDGAHDLTIEDITYIGRAGLDSCETFIIATTTTPCDRVRVRRLRGSHFTADAFKIGNFGVDCVFEDVLVLGWSAYTSAVVNWSSGLTVSAGDHIKYVDGGGVERTYECLFDGTAPEPSGLPEDDANYIYRGVYKHHDTFQGTPPGDVTVKRSYFDVRDLLGGGNLALNRHWQTGGGLEGGSVRFEDCTLLSELTPLYNFAPGGATVEILNNVLNPVGAKQLYPQATDAEWERITWTGNKRSTDGTLIPVQNALMQTTDGASEVTGDPVALEGFYPEHTDVESNGFTLTGFVTDEAAEQTVMISTSCDVGDPRDITFGGVSISPKAKYAHSANDGTDTMDSAVFPAGLSASQRDLSFSGGIFPRSPKAAAVLFSVSGSDPNLLVTKKVEGADGGTSVSGTVAVEEGDLIVAVMAAETPDGLAGLSWTGLDPQGGPVAVGDDFGYAIATKAVTADNASLPVGLSVDSAMNLPLLTLAVVKPAV